MSFSLSNTPTTFQEYVKKIFAKKLDMFVIIYLNDIMIYIKDLDQPNIEIVLWVLDQLRKYSLFTNLKKYCFYQNEICFLGYIVSSKGISMEAKKIKVVKNWLESKSVYDIQIFLGFANFYWRFIQSFNRIATLLISMLKMIGSADKIAPSRNIDNRSAFEKNNGNDEVDRFGSDDIKHAKKSGKSKVQNLSKSQKLAKSEKKLLKSRNLPNLGATKAGPSFIVFGARKAFNRL